MTAETQSLFELIRREGLIVIAIAALAWQVYWLTTSSQGQDEFWREEMTKYRDMITAMEMKNTETRVQTVAKVQEMSDRIQTMFRIVADMEEECQIFDARKQEHAKAVEELRRKSEEMGEPR
jgi:hypothetical protein